MRRDRIGTLMVVLALCVLFGGHLAVTLHYRSLGAGYRDLAIDCLDTLDQHERRISDILHHTRSDGWSFQAGAYNWED